MNIRSRLSALEKPLKDDPCRGLAKRLRAALDNPKVISDEENARTIAGLEAAGDPMSMRLARALCRNG